MYSGRSSCRCGAVVFELTGEPVAAPICCCNDCRTGVLYIDAKARAAGLSNTSALENGHDQSAYNVIFPLSGIKLVQGGEHMRKFRMRTKSSVVHTYTSCCNTSVVMLCGPFPFVQLGVGVPFNGNTLSPPPTPHSGFARIMCREATKPSELPIDAIPNSKLLTLAAFGRILWAATLGRTSWTDEAARALLTEHCSADEVTEVAGKAAYAAAGFPDVNA